ncbi:hypothetical protein BDZ91DRAFT_161124 [Kalaharituber pfeilii]|nr:hypothetical protein BDZ91DRAFT_161124 [Kalaharituber pfeilii]
MWEKGMTVPQEMAKEVYAEFLEQEMQGKEGKAKKLDKYHYDEMFTAAIKKKDRASALHVLAEMRAFSIPVRPAALHFFLRTLLLRPRIRGHAPKTLPPPHIVKDDLVAAINTLVGCLKAGMYVPPQFWWEVFKRLGMNQQLEDLERLAAFLVEWYHPARSAVMLKRYVGVGVGGVTVDASASTSSTTSTTTTFTSLSHSISDAAPNPDLGGSDAGHLPTVDPSGDPVPLTPYTHTPAISFLYFDPPRIIPTTIRPSHRASPVRLLFPAAFFRAITEWGFLGIFRRIPVLTDFPPLPPPYAKVKDQRRQTDITWGLRLAYYLHEAGVHVDPRVLLRAVAVRARAIYGKRPDRLRSRLNVSTRKILREEFPTLESFVREVNTVWRRLVGEESAVLFSTSLWKGIGHVDLREQVMEAVVLGRQETVDRRLWRRWKGMLGKGHEVTGTVWRDRNGRWRMSRNVLRRALRIKRTWDERARGVLGSWNTARGVAERHEGTGVDWWGRQSAGAGVGAEAGAAGASEDKKELWETEGWFDEFLKQESKTPDSTEPAAHPAPVLDRQLTGFPSVYHTPLQPQLQGQSEYFHGQHQKTSQGFRRLGHHSQMANDEYDEWYSQEAKRAKKRARRKRRLEREYQEWQAEAREVWELYGEPPQAGGKGVQEVMGRPVTVRGVDGRWRGMERRGGNVGGGSGGGRIGSGDGGYGRFV